MHRFRVLLGILALALLTLTACGGGESGTKAPEDSGSPEVSAPAQQAEPEPESNDSGEAQMTANSNSGATLWVTQPRGNRQCEGGGISLEQSRATLEGNGISVAESRCAVRTDRMYPSVCGGATGDILVHRIPASMLDAALQLGFDPASQVPHRFSKCPPDTGPGHSNPTH
ncbi:hypothetical protein [uncultured Microbulbifer sp.]|uniref:hypothetical protein n=1 Tax=uncultured Microbulbifer sp. TaxID=348147 RepID=UPI0025E413F8|nr:hypothetical protein [uncultured Microbulbifer sp.]